MINVWEYADAKRVSITAVDGSVFEGNVTEVTETEERSDLEEPEDGITIWTDDKRLIEFYQSEIKAIEVMSSESLAKAVG